MITRISLIILSTIFFHIPAIAEIKIVLSSRYEIKDNSSQLILGDFASIECSDMDCTELKNKPVDRELYIDGYLDRDEINSIMKGLSDDIFIIYGNAVRVISNTDTILANNKTHDEYNKDDILVKKGDVANLVLTRGGISIELFGKIMKDGRLGDLISVELKMISGGKTKLVKGKVSGRNQVEVDI